MPPSQDSSHRPPPVDRTALTGERSSLDARELALMGATVERLRAREGGIAEAVRPLIEARDAALEGLSAAPTDWGEVRRVLWVFDSVLVCALAGRYDPLDAAVARSGLLFAEIDRSGRVIYANRALAERAPGALGHPFPELFGPRRGDVADALRSGENVSLRVELYQPGQPCQQFRVEIGPLPDEQAGPGAYAFLLDVEAEEERLDAIPEAMLRIGPSGCIAFANAAVANLLGVDRRTLLGTPAAHLFLAVDEPPAEKVSRWLALEGRAEEAVALRARPSDAEASIIPFYDGNRRQRAGVLVSLDVIEPVRQHLQRLLTEPRDTLHLIRDVLRTVRAVVPCDLALFVVYSDGTRYARVVLADPPPRWKWRARWFDMREGYRRWLERGSTWAPDLQAFVSEVAPDQRQSPVLRAMCEDGLRGFVTLPIRGANGDFECAISLFSKKVAGYEKRDLERLQKLGLKGVLLAARAALNKDQEEKVSALKRRLEKAGSSERLAEELAKGLVDVFDWSYAGIYRVDRAAGKFVLFAQRDDTGDESLIVKSGDRKAYEQDMDTGALSHVYRTGEGVVIPDTGVDPKPYGYILLNEKHRSAMCLPLVEIDGRIELLLDVAADVENAFEGIDKADAKALIADCAPVFEARWRRAVTESLMSAMEQAAIVVDAAGEIRQTNAAAADLLGPDCVGKSLAGYGAAESDGSTPSGPMGRPVYRRLRVGGGEEILTRASSVPLHDDYDHKLWLLQDMKGLDRDRVWRYLERTVAETARQTRGPLLVADRLLRSAAGQQRSALAAPGGADLLDRAAGQLCMADLTFERLSDAYSVLEGPIEGPRPFDALAVLRQSLEDLPGNTKNRLSVDLGAAKPCPMEGWPSNLRFAFRSLLGAILLDDVAGATAAVRALSRDDLCVEFVRHGAVREASEAGSHDPSVIAAERAALAVRLAPEAVEKAIGRHKGTFRASTDVAAGSSQFTVTLPMLRTAEA